MQVNDTIVQRMRQGWVDVFPQVHCAMGGENEGCACRIFQLSVYFLIHVDPTLTGNRHD
jgi:hypothetical protein